MNHHPYRHFVNGKGHARPLSDDEIVAHVLKRSQELTGNMPVPVSYRPDPKATPCLCGRNVRDKIIRDGGFAVPGWRISEGTDLLMFWPHYVWYSPGGEVVDITPEERTFSAHGLDFENLMDGDCIVFVPDYWTEMPSCKFFPLNRASARLARRLGQQDRRRLHAERGARAA